MTIEFIKPIKAAHIHGQPQSFTLGADEETRAELAERFGLPGIALLTGVFVLAHERSGIIAADLTMRARVTQSCVITLEPFETEIAEQVQLRFVPATKLDVEEEVLAPESLEGPDEIPYEDGIIDLGEALAEQLALALDPYPRKPGAELPDEATATAVNPFAALKGKFGGPA